MLTELVSSWAHFMMVLKAKKAWRVLLEEDLSDLSQAQFIIQSTEFYKRAVSSVRSLVHLH